MTNVMEDLRTLILDSVDDPIIHNHLNFFFSGPNGEFVCSCENRILFVWMSENDIFYDFIDGKGDTCNCSTNFYKVIFCSILLKYGFCNTSKNPCSCLNFLTHMKRINDLYEINISKLKHVTITLTSELCTCPYEGHYDDCVCTFAKKLYQNSIDMKRPKIDDLIESVLNEIDKIIVNLTLSIV